MSYEPVDIMLATFNTSCQAHERLTMLKQCDQPGMHGIFDVVAFASDTHGVLTVVNAKRRGTRGVVTNGLTSALIRMFTAAAGITPFGILPTEEIIRTFSNGFFHSVIQQASALIPPEGSALVAILDSSRAAALEAFLARDYQTFFHTSIVVRTEMLSLEQYYVLYPVASVQLQSVQNADAPIAPTELESTIW